MALRIRACRVLRKAQISMDPRIRELSEYAAGLAYADLPAAVVHECKRKLLDTLGCAIGAFDAEPARIARFKLPRRVVWLAQLPKSALGKVQKPALQAQLLAAQKV